MPLFSFHHKPSTDPDVDSIGAIESLADLSNGVRIISKDGEDTSNEWYEEDSRDGRLVKMYAECDTEEAGSAFVRSLRRFGLLH